MRRFAITAAIFVLAAGVASLAATAQAPQPAASSCARCEKALDLSRTEWSCLVGRLPELATTTTPVVFFSLSPQICDANLRVQRGGGYVIPKSQQRSSVTPSTEPARVYRLSRSQIECLSRVAKNRAPRDRVQFDFAAECAMEARP